MTIVRRYDRAGKARDVVSPTVTRLGDFIYLSFEGKLGTVSFEIPVVEWSRMARVKRPTRVNNYLTQNAKIEDDISHNSIGYSTG